MTERGDRRQGGQPEWDPTIEEAVDDLHETEAAVVEVREERARRRRAGRYVLLALPVLAAVVAWNAWLLTREPEVPPVTEVAYALRENAAAVVQEVIAFRDAQGRLPSPGELGALLDDEMRYSVTGEAFEVSNTDGRVHVRYDGTMPLETWVTSGGHTLVEGGR